MELSEPSTGFEHNPGGYLYPLSIAQMKIYTGRPEAYIPSKEKVAVNRQLPYGVVVLGRRKGLEVPP